MPSSCRTTAAALLGLLAMTSASCGTGDDVNEATAQFERLEVALVTLAESPEQQWMDKLDEVKKLPVSHPRVAEVKDLCVSAYEAFGGATLRLEEARHRVAGVEILANRGPGDAGAQKISAMRSEALKSTAGVAEALDKAEKLVESCVASRKLLRRNLASGRLEE